MDERTSEAVSDTIYMLACGMDHALDSAGGRALRDEPGIREWSYLHPGDIPLRITIMVEPFESRFYDPPVESHECIEDETEYLYEGQLYRVCTRCNRIEALGILPEIVEETGRAYEWRDIPLPYGHYRAAVSLEDPSHCTECFEAICGEDDVRIRLGIL